MIFNRSAIFLILALSLNACKPAAEPGAVAVPSSQASAAPATAKLDYNRDIQPILSNACYHCHGPDASHRKAKLRLDIREKALSFKNEEGRHAIVPGRPDLSELVNRVESHDPDELMPQDPDKALKPEQIKMLRRWIFEGAEFRDHWAFEAPVKAALPAVSQKSWVKNELDRYVLAKLEAAGLKPNAEAGRAALLRRVSLDLTGLPPTPAEIATFVNDPAPTDQAYETQVDRLLASPRYGEHRSRHWLDYSRYADTHGIHNDGLRNIWPWRDYVIRSFNADKPYDRFTREQLAGDLDGDSIDAVVASGFIRNGIATGEGGTILEELRANLHKERSAAYGALFLGLTVQCAECHDHKYDPITAKDAYSLGAYFNNLAEHANTLDQPHWPPNYVVPTPAKRAEADALWAERAQVQKALDAHLGGLQAWITAGQNLPSAVDPSGLETWLPLDEGKGELVHNRAPGREEKYTITGPAPAWREMTHLWESFRLSSNTILALPEAGDFDKSQPFSAGGWVRLHSHFGGDGAGSFLSRMDDRPGAHYRGWDLHASGQSLKVILSSNFPGDAIEVSAQGIPHDQWIHVLFTYDGSGKAAGVKIYRDGQALALKIERDSLKGSLRTAVPLHVGRRLIGSQAQESAHQDLRIYRRVLSPEEVARMPFEHAAATILAAKPATFSPDQRWILSRVFASRDAEARRLQDSIAALDAQIAAASAGGQVTLVCKEAPTLPYTNVMDRGAYNARLERVAPATPSFLPGRIEGGDRRQLAEWTIKDNPLFARTAVNRVWQELFGIGLVESSDDFGIVGERPSNPELLDSLAVDFRDQGWSFKRLYRRIVLSATYRQDAKAPPEAYARDPKNILLARGPRFRMDAEMIRDSALFISGLMVEKQGGPSVRPYQPPGVWEAGSYADIYTQEHGEALYRRSLYTYWKRMAIMPDQEVMDAPDRQIACVRRPRTNTPLAALVLFNNVQLLEAARHLGRRAITEGGTGDAGRLEILARATLGRPLDAEETAILTKSLESFRSHYGSHPAEAAELLKLGESPKDAGIPDAEQAVWMMAAHQFFNLDEFLNK